MARIAVHIHTKVFACLIVSLHNNCIAVGAILFFASGHGEDGVLTGGSAFERLMISRVCKEAQELSLHLCLGRRFCCFASLCFCWIDQNTGDYSRYGNCGIEGILSVDRFSLARRLALGSDVQVCLRARLLGRSVAVQLYRT